MGVTIIILLAHIQVSGCIYISFPFWGPGWDSNLGLGTDFPQNQRVAHSISPAIHTATGKPKKGSSQEG